MDIKEQLLSLTFSAFMGVVMYLSSVCNYKIIKKKRTVLKYVFSLMLMIDFNLLYLVGLYFINGGIVHMYFLFVLLLSYLLTVKLVPMVLKNDKFLKKWCYNENNRRV